MDRIKNKAMEGGHRDLLWSTRVEERFHVEVHRDEEPNRCHFHMWDDERNREVSHIPRLIMYRTPDNLIDRSCYYEWYRYIDMVLDQQDHAHR